MTNVIDRAPAGTLPYVPPRTALTRISLSVGAAALMAAASLTFPNAAQADAVADFYKGKSITLLIGASAGGSYDIYARVLAAHLSKHIPGNPNIVSKIMVGGGGGLPTAIHMQGSAARDGTVIAITQQSIVVSQLIQPIAAGKYDTRTWHWLGLMAPIRDMLAVWHTAPAQTLEEATKKEVVVGATGRTSSTYIFPQLLNQIAGTKFKIVTGYQGVAGLNLAMERGEIQGRGASWVSIVTGAPHYITEKKLKPLVFDGLTKEPGFPDTPLIVSLAKDDLQRQTLTLISSGAEFGRAFFVPPGVPADRVAALRKAFDAAMKDPALLAEAKTRKIPIEPQTGEQLHKTTATVLSSSPEAVAGARTLMGSK